MAKRSTASQNTRLFDWILILLLVCVPLVWSSQFVFVAYYPKLLALYIGLFLLYGVWFFQKQRPHYSTSTLTLPIVAYVLISILSIYQASNRIESIIHLSHLITLPLFFWGVLNNYRSQNLQKYLSWAVGTGIFIAILGLIQYAGWGLHWIPSAGFPSSTLGYRNYAAMYTILCIPLGLYLFLESTHEKQHYLWGLGTAILFTFLICTRTRGAWLGLSVGLVLGGLLLLILRTHDGQALYKALFNTCTKQHLPPAVAGVVLCILFIFLVPPNMEGRGFDRGRPDKDSIISSAVSIIDHEKDTRKSIQTRLDMWENSLSLFKEAPVLGVGIGNWQYEYPPYDEGESVWEGATPRRPHNDYIWIATEQGIVGLLTYLWILVTAFFLIFRLIRTLNRSRVALPFFIGIAIIALSTHAAFSFPKERIAISMLFWFYLTILAILETDNRPRSHSSVWKMAHVIGLLIIASGLLLSVRALKFDAHFARAQQAVERNDWNQVVRETSAAINQGLFDPQIYLLRGVGHTYLGNYQQAANDNLTCLSYHPHFLNALNNMGLIYNTLQNYQQSIPYLQQALEINPQHADAYANLGVAYQGLQEFDKSVSSFETAFEIESDNPQIRIYLGKAYYSQGDNQLQLGNTHKAKTAFENFLKIWQGDAHSANVVRQKLSELQTP